MDLKSCRKSRKDHKAVDKKDENRSSRRPENRITDANVHSYSEGRKEVSEGMQKLHMKNKSDGNRADDISVLLQYFNVEDNVAPGGIPPKKLENTFKKSLNIYFSVQVVREFYYWGIWPQKEFKLSDNDCDLDSELYVNIAESIHNTFDGEMEKRFPSLINEPSLVRINRPVLSDEGDYLSFQLVLDMSDGASVPEKYRYPGTRESLQLWKQLKPAIEKAAKFENFETNVKLKDWIHSSIIMILNIIKNVKSLWTNEETSTFVKRADHALRQIQLDTPLQYVSIIRDNFLKFQIDIISLDEAVVDAVGSFTYSFKSKLLHRTVNGDPSFKIEPKAVENDRQKELTPSYKKEPKRADKESNIHYSLSSLYSVKANENRAYSSLKEEKKRARHLRPSFQRSTNISIYELNNTQAPKTGYDKLSDLIILGLSSRSYTKIVKTGELRRLIRLNNRSILMDLLRTQRAGRCANRNVILLCLGIYYVDYVKREQEKEDFGDFVCWICRIPSDLFKLMNVVGNKQEVKADFPNCPELKDLYALMNKNPLKSNARKTDADSLSSSMKSLDIRDVPSNYSRFLKRHTFIKSWYLDERKTPEDLLYLLTKFKQRYGWNHKTILRLGHFKFSGNESDDGKETKDLVINYILHGLQNIQKVETYRDYLECCDDPEYDGRKLQIDEVTSRILSTMHILEKSKNCSESEFFASIERLLPLKYPRKSQDTERLLPLKPQVTDFVFTYGGDNEDESEDDWSGLTILADDSRLSDAFCDIDESITIGSNLSHKQFPTTHYRISKLWEALLQDMSITELMQHISNMASLGVFDKAEESHTNVVKVLESLQIPKKLARVHPYQILAAVLQYKGSGRAKKKTNRARKKKDPWIVDDDLYTGLCESFKNCMKSFMPESYKLGLVSTLLYRTYMISSSYISLHEEFEKLKRVFSKNGYPSSFVDKCVSRFLNKLHEKKKIFHTVPKMDMMIVLPFLGTTSWKVNPCTVNDNMDMTSKLQYKVCIQASESMLDSGFMGKPNLSRAGASIAMAHGIQQSCPNTDIKICRREAYGVDVISKRKDKKTKTRTIVGEKEKDLHSRVTSVKAHRIRQVAEAEAKAETSSSYKGWQYHSQPCRVAPAWSTKKRNSDLSAPITESVKNAEKIDAFIIFTTCIDAELIDSKAPYKEFKRYQTKVNRNAKFILCAMDVTSETEEMADADDSNVKFLCGADGSLLQEIIIFMHPERFESNTM